MTSALETLKHHERRRDEAARAWKAAGGRVIGYICETVPRELITAAGFLAYRVSGDPETDSKPAQARWVHTLAPKGFSSARNSYDPEYVNSIGSLVLEGRYDFLDALVISNTKKTILLLAGQLREAARAWPELKIPRLYILDRAQTTSLASHMFNRERVLAFKAELETWAGRPIPDAALEAAIAEGNATRALLRRTRRLRNEARLSGTEALAIYASSKLMPAATFNPLAEAALDDAAGRAPRTGKRLFVGGSANDHGQLYALLEAGGALVVGDDQAWGDRAAEDDIAGGTSPLEAMITHYESLNPLIYPLSRSVERTVALAREARAAGAVLNCVRRDDIKLWEAPDEARALNAAGIPALHLQEQPYDVRGANDLAERTAAFLADLPEALA